MTPAQIGLGNVPWVDLGVWPTPIVRVGETWWKCEGDSHPAYGGNKVRTLEAWLGHARARGADRIWAIGAYGSNHTIATVVHGARVGLRVGAIVFPQPGSEWAIENCAALLASGASGEVEIVRLRSVVEVPFAVARIAARHRGDVIMPPGGATPVGTLGALVGAFELAEQIARGEAPPPSRIVVAAGSTCTSAGLLAGIALARSAGAWPWPPPIVHAVRVTPWPITSRAQIVHLAKRTLARVAALGEPAIAAAARAIDRRALSAGLAIDGRELGPGYGQPTPTARHAIATFSRAGAPRLDGVYTGKAAAALLRLARTEPDLLFWSSKSTALVAGDRAATATWFRATS
jgi:D-cysteine desulfhydrase